MFGTRSLITIEIVVCRVWGMGKNLLALMWKQ